LPEQNRIMKNIDLKKALPHFVAVISFLLLSILLNKPALEGKAVQHSNLLSSKRSMVISQDGPTA
jgi:hypothetical protein